MIHSRMILLCFLESKVPCDPTTSGYGSASDPEPSHVVPSLGSTIIEQ